MAAADLQGPLDDFLDRIFHIRSIVATVETVSRAPGIVSTTRQINLSNMGLQTGNTANAMSMVFLASSFEEFVREEISQCASYLSDRYLHLTDPTRHSTRNSYWAASLDKLRFHQSILTKKLPDANVIGKIRPLLESLQKFVMSDDPSAIVPSVFAHHSNNFKPAIINDVANRIGIKELIPSAAESTKIKAYFGVTKKHVAAEMLTFKLNEFYDRRNQIVHSLNSSAGYAADVVLDYTNILEMTAHSIRDVLDREIKKW